MANSGWLHRQLQYYARQQQQQQQGRPSGHPGVPLSDVLSV